MGEGSTDAGEVVRTASQLSWVLMGGLAGIAEIFGEAESRWGEPHWVGLVFIRRLALSGWCHKGVASP
jgi:hypothetical protein